jgi:hypothetical protein
MLLVTVVIVLYAAAALTFKQQLANWKSEERVYQAAQKKLQDEKDLIAARSEWDAKYEKMRSLMPVFPEGKDVGTHWLKVTDTTATRNGVAISRQQGNDEVEVGDVYELPIVCSDWEAPLEALVKFLYDLNQQGAMLDVRQLVVRQAKPGYLKGSFALFCAYMRGDAGKPPPSASERPAEASPAEASPAEAPAAEAPAAEAPAAEAPAASAEAQPAPAEPVAPAAVSNALEAPPPAVPPAVSPAAEPEAPPVPAEPAAPGAP